MKKQKLAGLVLAAFLATGVLGAGSVSAATTNATAKKACNTTKQVATKAINKAYTAEVKAANKTYNKTVTQNRVAFFKGAGKNKQVADVKLVASKAKAMGVYNKAKISALAKKNAALKAANATFQTCVAAAKTTK